MPNQTVTADSIRLAVIEQPGSICQSMAQEIARLVIAYERAHPELRAEYEEECAAKQKEVHVS